MFLRALAVVYFALVLGAPAEGHWAYLPPAPQTPPGSASLHPVDAFLAGAWTKAKVSPAKSASPRRWIERAAFTLTGLPPSPDQIQRIEKSPDDATWKALIDELLASPAYGERWARHWMDVARYADTQGYNFDKDNRYPFAYTYRDWLIRAFNADLPYDRFIKLQIAADHLTDRPDHPDLAALGFITVGPRGGPLETIDDRVDVVTRGFLSSTVACARCHDHKTDPITTEDFYSIYSIFENIVEPSEKPVIGKPVDESAHQAYLVEYAKRKEEDRLARQELVDHVRSPATSAVYLELAWLAVHEKWDTGKISSESFKRGRFRVDAVQRWRAFFEQHAFGKTPSPRLASWTGQMTPADDTARKALSLALATEWSQATPDSELGKLAARDRCPLACGIDRIHEFMDTTDDNLRRDREAKMAKLQIEHPGSPPRAMCFNDSPQWKPAQVYIRGNIGNREEPFDRAWLSFLGGGAFPKDKSARLSLAERIADPANPLTARVIVNRVWGWHFGQPLTEPGDFGPQQPAPPLLPLLDWLAVRFNEKGGSIKELHRLLLTSQAFRLAADGPPANDAIDEANTLFWKWNRRRADFESMRDRLLATSGALETSTIGGRSINLDTPQADPRRSVYALVDRYALPGTFVSFDLPHPDHHAPKRSETTVPQQALYFLNGPMVLRQAEKFVGSAEFKNLPDDSARIRWIYSRLFQRNPGNAEATDALEWIANVDPADYQPRVDGVWEIRHAPETGGPLGEVFPFPLFEKAMWKTGPDPATALLGHLGAKADGGHPFQNHVLVIRWRATGSGEVRMIGSLSRKPKEGAPLEWKVVGKNIETLAEGKLPPDSSGIKLDGKWTAVKPGDTVDFLLTAPEGASHGSTTWDIRMSGRDRAGAKVSEISNLKKEFPTSTSPPPVIVPASPWADLVQMLWSSNEFHFID